jgi:transcriptional regulator with XRE-family HTH domain
MTDAQSDRLELAARLRDARETTRLTQSDVATALGIPRSGVADIERGQRNVTVLELRRLAQLYGRDLAWLAVAFDSVNDETNVEIQDAVAGLSESDRRLVVQYARFLASQAVTRA